MKRNHENTTALLFIIGTIAFAFFFLALAYILLFRPEMILTVLRYAAAIISAAIGVALAAYGVKLVRRYLRMKF